MSEREENQEVNVDDFIPATKYMAENNLSNLELLARILDKTFYAYAFLENPHAAQYPIMYRGIAKLNLEPDLVLSTSIASSTELSTDLSVYSETFTCDLTGFFKLPEWVAENTLTKGKSEYKDAHCVKPLSTNRALGKYSLTQKQGGLRSLSIVIDSIVNMGLIDNKSVLPGLPSELNNELIQISKLADNDTQKLPKIIRLGKLIRDLDIGNCSSKPVCFSGEAILKETKLKEELFRLSNQLSEKDKTIIKKLVERLGEENHKALDEPVIFRHVPEECLVSLDNLYIYHDDIPGLSFEDIFLNQEKKHSLKSSTAPKEQDKNKSELLKAQLLAQEKFWLNYDPADPTTAPLKSAVVEFLESKGFARSLAEKADTILRGGRNRPN